MVEGDLFFEDESSLRNHYDGRVNGAQRKLALGSSLETGVTNEFERNQDALDITYCVSDDLANQSTVVSDMEKATQAWERVANVNFRYVSAHDDDCDADTDEVDFAVVDFDTYVRPATAAAGCAWNKHSVFHGGKCSGLLAINYGPAPPGYPNVTPLGVLRHELGHILGFRHEHAFADDMGGCAEAPDLVDGGVSGELVTAYDSDSVMHYPWCDGNPATDISLTKLDGEGARVVYGMPASWYVAL